MGPIQFTVEGSPPKKNGAKSMWGNETQAKRLVALREKALREKGSQPFTGKVQLRVTVRVSDQPGQDPGDLDNLVSGVCDGLMKAHPNALAWINKDEKFKKLWPNNSIHPSRAIAFEDDKQVMRICAEKRIGPGKGSYEIRLEKVAGE